jgi:ABC-2 type transport system permease protein
MSRIGWRIAPILTLTVRQFLGGKAVRVIMGLSLIPVIFAAIYLLNTGARTQVDYLVTVIYRGAVGPTLLPITILILATGALGNEIEDRTLPYLTMKPISRFRIVFEKVIGTIIIVAPIIMIGLAASFFIVMRGAWNDNNNLRVLWALLAASAAASVAYSAIFALVSLLISRALLAGIVYSIVWESVLGRYLPGVRYVSVRHYTESIFVDVIKDPNVVLKNSFGLGAAIITILVAAAAAVLLSTWRLRRMNLE